ncbi:MAG: HEPN domain-containing protein [Bacillota bacterium]|nr:HEPN domain-containing protein [Bacillota bacterium]
MLLAKGLSSPKHTGVRSLFHQQVVKPGLVGISAGQLHDRLFDNRQKSDYADLVTFKADDVREWLQEVRAFVGDIRELTLCEVEKETTT